MQVKWSRSGLLFYNSKCGRYEIERTDTQGSKPVFTLRIRTTRDTLAVGGLMLCKAAAQKERDSYEAALRDIIEGKV
jgi:hypothetical protein